MQKQQATWVVNDWKKISGIKLYYQYKAGLLYHLPYIKFVLKYVNFNNRNICSKWDLTYEKLSKGIFNQSLSPSKLYSRGLLQQGMLSNYGTT